MHHDRIDPNLLQQRDVTAEFQCEVLFTHRVPAIFHHHRRPGISPQERQRLSQDMGPPSGG